MNKPFDIVLMVGIPGSGKTTFCRRLLPEELQRYYNDNLPMKNDKDIYNSISPSSGASHASSTTRT